MEKVVPPGKTVAEALEGVRRCLERSENPLITPSSPPRSEPCHECGGTGWRHVEKDKVVGVVHCQCAIERARRRKMEEIPPRYRWAQFQSLEPHPDLERWGVGPEIQARVIRLLKEYPDGSFAFFGPTGVGKTTYLYALYGYAVETQLHGCFCVQMPRLVSDLRALERGDEIEPYLSRRMIRTLHEDAIRPRVFIDEFDKVNTTDFALNAVGELIDEIYKLSGQDGKGVQLVVATNLRREEFISVWGNNILRRIEEVCRVVDFFVAIGKPFPAEARNTVAAR